MKSATPVAGEQFVKDAQGHPVAVVLDIATYERLREAQEELADIRAFDEAWSGAQEDLKKGNVVSLENYVAGRKSHGK
jgi:PHD/YefM family antitoxin component YafN of YafNO toxin-antitoxin module